MKKMVLTFLSLMVLSTFILALNQPVGIPIYRFKTPTGWTEETNQTLANATATNEWDSGGYVDLLSTYQTSRINWELNVSQWIFVNIKYLRFNIHVNMPGDYAIDNLDISVKTNGGVKVYIDTPGDLSDGNGHSIPTWIGYVENQNGAMLPKLGETNVNFSWLRIEELPDEDDSFTILNPCGTTHPCGLGTKTYQVWFGFRINNTTCKGTYSTYLDIFIQPEP